MKIEILKENSDFINPGIYNVYGINIIIENNFYKILYLICESERVIFADSSYTKIISNELINAYTDIYCDKKYKRISIAEYNEFSKYDHFY